MAYNGLININICLMSFVIKMLLHVTIIKLIHSYKSDDSSALLRQSIYFKYILLDSVG